MSFDHHYAILHFMLLSMQEVTQWRLIITDCGNRINGILVRITTAMECGPDDIVELNTEQ